MKRRVKIILSSKYNVWLVEFVDRKKYQKHLAGQFTADDHTYEQVKAWVETQEKLKL